MIEIINDSTGNTIDLIKNDGGKQNRALPGHGTVDPAMAQLTQPWRCHSTADRAGPDLAAALNHDDGAGDDDDDDDDDDKNKI